MSHPTDNAPFKNTGDMAAQGNQRADNQVNPFSEQSMPIAKIARYDHGIDRSNQLSTEHPINSGDRITITNQTVEITNNDKNSEIIDAQTNMHKNKDATTNSDDILIEGAHNGASSLKEASKTIPYDKQYSITGKEAAPLEAEPQLVKREHIIEPKPRDIIEEERIESPHTSDVVIKNQNIHDYSHLGKEMHRCAESVIYYQKAPFDHCHFGPCIVKHRLAKRYRIDEIEKNLSISRLKQEVSNLGRARSLGIPVPAIYSVNIKHKFICIEYLLDHVTLKEYLASKAGRYDDATITEMKDIFVLLGKYIAQLHNGNIVHGDLTSSNVMIEKNSLKLKLIDFGLSSPSANIEDKAVDLYVFEKSLQCDQSEEDKLDTFVDALYTGYIANSEKLDAVVQRLQKVKLRGRKKIAFG